jgi:uncharacterized repeat protein (TIGR01451 family)/CSLREA domain-containing protein
MKQANFFQPLSFIGLSVALLLSAAWIPGRAFMQDRTKLQDDGSPPSAVFTVNSAADTTPGACDAADCTLREAIIAANSNPGADTINFQIGTGLQTINVTSALPLVSGSVTIDGTTQPGFTNKPLIELNGVSTGEGISGLTITGGNSTIRGLVINRFGEHGIVLQSGGNVVEGNFIGTDSAGTSAAGNDMTGVLVGAGTNNRIGGASAASRNVISGNIAQGILFFGTATSANQVQGNIIGLDFTGTSAIPNLSDGIEVLASPNNMITAGNVISGNAGKGIFVLGSDSTGTVIEGNFIGTDITGTLPRGNNSDGVDISFQGANNQIEGNVISGNGDNGVRINQGAGNSIKGNYIGVAANATSALGNGFKGVFIGTGASNTSVGGTATGEGNIIAFNGDTGVVVESGTGNAIRSNSIFANGAVKGGIGIDLGDNGVTPNDAGDGDTGANNLQNFPVITKAVSTVSGGSNIQGTLGSTPNMTFTIEFFSNATCHAVGNGEGQTLIGSTEVTTGGSGDASFNVDFAASVMPGRRITATATDSLGNTSEFSACFTFVGLADLSISKGASPPTITVGANVTYTIIVTNNGPNAAQTITVTDDLPATTTFIDCSSTGGGVCGGTGNNRTVTFGSLPASASATITITARVNCSVPDGTMIGNTATVATSTTQDPNATNNSSTATITASSPPAVLTPTSANFGGSGGTSTVSVTFTAGCPWTAVSNDPWIMITQGSSGNGNGTVTYQVEPYAGGTPRTGTMTIAGQTFTVNQSNAPCTFTLNPTQASYPAAGGSSSFTVTSLSGCQWMAVSNATWITITQGSSGNGNGTVNYTVAANTMDARTGTITVADQTFTVMQASGCSFMITPATRAFAAAGGPGSFSLITNTGCSWMAVSNDPWLSITSAASGSGSQMISFLVGANQGEKYRSGTITVAGLTFTVAQEGAGPGTCNNAIYPTSASFPVNGGEGTTNVTANGECFWTAVSNVSWVTIKSGAAGLGSGSVQFVVAANNTELARVGTLTIAGKTFTVKQKGP